MSDLIKYILIVEDHPIAAMVAKSIFQSFNHLVDIAKDGAEAIRCIDSDKTYDVICMDIGLPDMTGIDVYNYIRHKEKKENIDAVPIIAVTANSDYEQACFKIGMQDVIIKPITKEKALKILSYCGNK